MTSPSEPALAHPTVTLRCTSCGRDLRRHRAALGVRVWRPAHRGLRMARRAHDGSSCGPGARSPRCRPLALRALLASPCCWRITGNAWRGRHAARPPAALGRAPRSAPRLRQAGVRLAHRLVQGPWRRGGGDEGCRMGRQPDGRGFLRQRWRVYRRLQCAGRYCLRHICPSSGPDRQSTAH